MFTVAIFFHFPRLTLRLFWVRAFKALFAIFTWSCAIRVPVLWSCINIGCSKVVCIRVVILFIWLICPRQLVDWSYCKLVRLKYEMWMSYSNLYKNYINGSRPFLSMFKSIFVLKMFIFLLFLVQIYSGLYEKSKQLSVRCIFFSTGRLYKWAYSRASDSIYISVNLCYFHMVVTGIKVFFI